MKEEIVRCKNCNYHYVYGDNVRYNMCLLQHSKAQPDDWFCADGEPKDDSTGSCDPDYCELNLDGDDQ